MSDRAPAPASTTSTPATELARERAAWHAQRLAALQAEDGWLTLVGLDFLTDGEHSFGAGAAAVLRYPNCAEDLVGTFEVRGQQVRFRHAGAKDAQALTADDAGTPSVIRSGPVSCTLVRRNGRLALRVRDNASPVRTGFTGIDLFAFDPDLVVQAEVRPAKAGEVIAITNVTGFVEEQPVAARLGFELAGARHEFVATAGAGGRLFVVFGDATNGGETYGGGRFLEVAGPVDGRATLDFNRAYNPPCSFTAYATCPLPPGPNRLGYAVRAGERTAGTSRKSDGR
ncbi:MAG: hypothetical protein RL354_1758 [Planctomycetota bacterium]